MQTQFEARRAEIQRLTIREIAIMQSQIDELKKN